MSEGDRAMAGKLALVTGASRGIGAATARRLAADGMHVILTARRAGALEEVEEAIHQAGGSATIAPLDLAEPDAIGRLADAVAERWGRLDVLLLNAAYLPSLGPVTQIDLKEWNRALTVNVLATQALLGAFDPLLRRSDGAQVIGLTSSVGQQPRPFWGGYAATKAAFDTLLATYAQEVAQTSSVRVAIVDPGATRTEMRARAYPGEDAGTLKPPEVVAEHLSALLHRGFATGHRERVGG